MFQSLSFYRRFVGVLFMLLFTVALFRANSDHSKSSDYESEATEVHTFSSFWDSFFSGSKDSNTVTGTNGIEELAKPVPACTMNEEEQAAMISSLKAKQVGSPLVMVDQGMVDFKAKVGRATWVLLHSIAAKYSETPTEQQREHLLALFAVLPKVYPCDECARDMSGLLRQDPPVVTSGKAFGDWLCQFHNKVNLKLGKPVFDCSQWEDEWKPHQSCGCQLPVAGDFSMSPPHQLNEQGPAPNGESALRNPENNLQTPIRVLKP